MSERPTGRLLSAALSFRLSFYHVFAGRGGLQHPFRRLLNLISVALVLITAMRMILFCGAVPIAGYANNLDFFRQSACVGVWQSYPGSQRIAAHLAGPIDDVTYDGHRDAYFCMRSSDNLFPWAVAHLFGKHAHFGLHDIGLAKVAVSVALMVFIVAQPVGAGLRLAMALAFMLVFGDVAVLAYFNTLYVDASGLIFTTALIGLIACVAQGRRGPGWVVWGVIALCVAWLGTVKPQYAPLAAVLGLATSLVFFTVWRDRVRGLALAAVAVLTPVMFFALNDGADNIMRVVASVDITDTVLEAVLPHASDWAQAMRMLRLPPTCGQDIGLNSYTMTAAQRAACPEVSSVSRARLIPLFVVQPGTLFGPLGVAVGMAKPGYIGLANFEAPRKAAGWRFRLLEATSLSTGLEMMPAGVYAALIWLAVGSSVFLAPLIGVWLSRIGSPVHRRFARAAVLPAAGGIVCAYAVASSVFGDGYTELARHAACTFVGLVCFVTGLFRAGLSAFNDSYDPAN
jgi:hypothetical protein